MYETRKRVESSPIEHELPLKRSRKATKEIEPLPAQPQEKVLFLIS